jgi:hypothetical protein
MWKKALIKAEKRILQWRQLHPGMLFSVMAHNHHILPVLCYIAQLVPPSAAVSKMLDSAVAQLLPGPGNWITPCMARGLKHFGLSCQFLDINLISMASMQRYYKRSCLDIDSMSTELYLQSVAYSRSNGHNERFAAWHDASFSLNLVRSTSHCSDLGAPPKDVQAWICEPVQKGKPSGLQRRLTKRLHENRYGRAKAINQLRRRLLRWRLGLNPRLCTDIVLKNFGILARTCKPAVQAAYRRTVLNGWVTRRRMRSAKASETGCGHCVFHCGHGSDSIEHYACCRIITNFFRKSGIAYAIPSLASFLMVSRRVAKDKISLQAACLYAVYLTHNILRHSSMTNPTEERINGLLRASFARSGGRRKFRKA